MFKKSIFTIAIAGMGVILALPACQSSPGWEYMPDMYRGPAIETYESDGNFPDSLTALKPVEGTIPRGWMSYEKLPNTNEGYEASRQMKAPEGLALDSGAMAGAKVLYGIYCAHCHGAKGDGQGVLVERKKFLGVPSYADRDINMGTIFHVVTYGRNMMGSHATQLSPEERWKVAKYVMNLKTELSGGSVSDSTQTQEVISSAPEVAQAEATANEKVNDK